MSSDRSSSGEGVRRRDVLCAGGAGALATIIHTLLGPAEAARAEGITGSVPEVDSLTVHVVTDNYQFAIAPSRGVPGVVVQHFGLRLSAERPPDRTLLSEFGLSLHAESQRGRESRRVLVDFGFTPQALNNNIDLLGVEPSQLNALVLSHALRSFEKPLSPTSMRAGVDHGLGCFADRLPKEERTKTWVPDQFRHEIATCFNVKLPNAMWRTARQPDQGEIPR